MVDSPALIWGVAEPHRLSPQAELVLSGDSHELIVSISSLWEITIKMAKGKLTPLGASIQDLLQLLSRRAVQVLSIHPTHLVHLESLSYHHRDPFDRLLIAQAIAEGVPILTSDKFFSRYSVITLW